MTTPFRIWLQSHLQTYDLSNRDLSAATGINDSILGRYLAGSALPGYENLLRFKMWLEDLFAEDAGPGFDANIWFNEWLATKFRDAAQAVYQTAPDPAVVDLMKIDESAVPESLRNFGGWLCAFLLITEMTNKQFAGEIAANHTSIGFYLRTDEEQRLPTLGTLIKIERWLEDQAELAGWPVPDANMYWEPDTAASWLRNLAKSIGRRVSLDDISKPIERFVKEGKCRE